MTDSPNGSGDGGPLHNLGAINETLRKTFGQVYEIDEQIERAKETHIKPLTEDKGEFWASAKEASDVPMAAMKAEYKLYKLARDARADAASPDPDIAEDGRKLLDGIAVAHEALHPGESVDWVSVIESTLPAH